MTQLVCNGERLDLYENTSLQFTEENPLFAFDKIKCERTTSFKLPATPTNDRVFALARIPAYAGEGMRRKFAAQLQMGVIVKDGYLYIANYDGKDYNGIFVTGELLGLQAIRNAGKIADILQYSGTTAYGTTSGMTAREQLFSSLNYKNDEVPFPSLRLRSLITGALDALGVGYTLPTEPQYVRYVTGKASGLKKMATQFVATQDTMSTSDYPICYGLNMPPYSAIVSKTNAKVGWGTSATMPTHFGKIEQFKAWQNLQISFPEDWDDDLFVGYFVNTDVPAEQGLLSLFQFYGDRSFDEDGNVSGESLRGRTVNVARNGYFVIINKAGYVKQQTSGGMQVGWILPSVDCTFDIAGGEVEMGSYLRAQDNLPDTTVTDLLKIYAALAGKQLYYTDEDGILFDDLNFSSWTIKSVDNIISMSSISRTFADYAQRNVVRFKDEDGTGYPRIEIAYTVPNDNLENEKVLQEIPYSEGTSGGMDGDRTVSEIPSGTAALADANTSGAYMVRPMLIRNAGVQALCNASTQVEVRACMNAYEYAQITSKTKIVVRGTAYVWTSRSWQNDVAKFTLAKLP